MGGDSVLRKGPRSGGLGDIDAVHADFRRAGFSIRRRQPAARLVAMEQREIAAADREFEAETAEPLAAPIHGGGGHGSQGIGQLHVGRSCAATLYGLQGLATEGAADYSSGSAMASSAYRARNFKNSLWTSN